MTNSQLQCSWLMDNDDEGDDESVEAPPFSPLSAVDVDDVNLRGTDTGSEVSERDNDDDDFVDDFVDDIVNEDVVNEDVVNDVDNDEDFTTYETSSTVDTTIAINSRVCNGYKIVLDNFDRNIRASYQRIDRTTESFHCVHFYAALDRIDFSGFSDMLPTQKQVDLNSLLPTAAEVDIVKEHFATLISR